MQARPASDLLLLLLPCELAYWLNTELCLVTLGGNACWSAYCGRQVAVGIMLVAYRTSGI